MKQVTYIFAVFILLSTLSLQAEDPVFKASAPATVTVGQQFQYTIEGNVQGKISTPKMDGFDLLGGPFSSFSSSTRWVNGRMTATTSATYTYILRGSKEGEFVIPPATIQVKRDSYTTNEVTVNVVASNSSGGQPAQGNAQPVSQGGNSSTATNTADPEVFLRVIPSKTDVYLGEQFVSSLKIYTRVNTRPAGAIKELPYESFYKHQLEGDQSASREKINGQEYVTQVLQRHILIPQKTGKMVIEPYESEWTVPKRVQRSRRGSTFDDFFSDPFNDPFFNSYQDVPVKLSTKPVTIQVKPLPGSAPVGFTGAVGDFKMKASLSADNVKVNDALNLVVTISGKGNISLLVEPKVSFPPDHDVYETNKKVNISNRGNQISGSVTFEYPMVARHAGSFRIAPVSFSWFDPDEGKYKAITTDEFNFKVEKGEGGSEQSGVYLPGLQGESVADIGSDILDIERKVPEFSPINNSYASKPIYWMLYPLLLLIFIFAGVFMKIILKQRADLKLTRNRRASRLAKNRLKTADRARKSGKTEEFYEESEKAIWGYLSDKLGIELSALSRDKVFEVMSTRGVEETIMEEMFRIIEDCEFSRYAPSSEKRDMDQLYREAAGLIRNLEQNIRK